MSILRLCYLVTILLGCSSNRYTAFCNGSELRGIVEEQEERTTSTTTAATAAAAATTNSYSGNNKFLHFGRMLQNPVDEVLTGLVNFFMPAVADELEDNIAPAQLDPLYLGYSDTRDLGAVELILNNTFCNDRSATANLLYDLNKMTGLGSVDITRLELRSGSQDISVDGVGSFFGVSGADWSGVWDIDAEFDEFNAETIATLQTTFCNFTFEEILSGTSTLGSPFGSMEMYIEGRIENIYQVRETGTITNARVRNMDVNFASVSTDLGWTNDNVRINADDVATDLVDTGLTEGTLIPLIQQSVQKGIDDNLPFSLGPQVGK